MWLLAAPPLALAQGTVTSITPNPVPAIACQLNTIEINGTGTCGTQGQANGFTVELGDSTPTVHLPGNFPIKVYHAYKSAGTYTLRAQGATKCTGTVTRKLQVLGPVITSIFPFSRITPGGAVILLGQNFGNLPGQILIKFQNQLIGTPLENIQWGDTFAAGTIPSDITGVTDQQVTLTVFAQCGAASNDLSVHFTATRDMAAHSAAPHHLLDLGRRRQQRPMPELGTGQLAGGMWLLSEFRPAEGPDRLLRLPRLGLGLFRRNRQRPVLAVAGAAEWLGAVLGQRPLLGQDRQRQLRQRERKPARHQRAERFGELEGRQLRGHLLLGRYVHHRTGGRGVLTMHASCQPSATGERP